MSDKYFHFTLTKKDGWQKLASILLINKNFTNNGGSFRGEAWPCIEVDGYSPYSPRPYAGKMEPEEYNQLVYDSIKGIKYVVWSYQTPIAWKRKNDTWHVTDNNYSKTTATHLGKLRTAIGYLSGETSK